MGCYLQLVHVVRYYQPERTWSMWWSWRELPSLGRPHSNVCPTPPPKWAPETQERQERRLVGRRCEHASSGTWIARGRNGVPASRQRCRNEHGYPRLSRRIETPRLDGPPPWFRLLSFLTCKHNCVSTEDSRFGGNYEVVVVDKISTGSRSNWREMTWYCEI